MAIIQESCHGKDGQNDGLIKKCERMAIKRNFQSGDHYTLELIGDPDMCGFLVDEAVTSAKSVMHKLGGICDTTYGF